MTRKRQQRKNASKNIRRRKKPQRKLGFSAGVFLMVLAFSLMGVRTVLDNLPTNNTKNPQQTNTAATNSTTTETTTKAPNQQPFPQQPAHLTLRQEPPTTNGMPTSNRDTKVNVPIRPHNPRKGASSASTKIIILGHLGCRPCRQSLRVALDYVREHPITAQVVSKLALPEGGDQAGMEAALLSYIAQEELVFWETLKHFNHTPQKAATQISGPSSRTSAPTSSGASSSKLENGHTNNQLLEALAAVGMPLAQIRTKLRNKTSLYMTYLEQDLEDLNAKVLNKNNLPIVILNGKIIQPQSSTADNKQLQAQLNALN